MISLCMIVKNEEKYLKKCLENVLPLVDEVIVVDTGSTDATLEIINDFDNQIQLKKFDWINDFSAARNYSLKYATQEWVLVLDADEMIYYDKEKVIEYLSNIESNIINIPIFSLNDEALPTYSAEMPRLYKRQNAIYNGKIHEQLIYNNEIIVGDIIDQDIIHIVHYGYLAETKTEKDKKNRNIYILKEAIEEEPNRAFNWYNLGVSHMSNENYDLALNAFLDWSKIKKDILPSYYVDVIIRVAVCLYELRNYTQLEQHLLDYIEDDYVRSNPDYFVRLGQLYRVIGKEKKAMNYYMKAVEIGDNNTRIRTVGIGSFIPKFEIAKLHIRNKEIAKGLIYYIEGVFCRENKGFNGFIELEKVLTKKSKYDLLEICKQEIYKMNQYSTKSNAYNSNELEITKKEFFVNLEIMINENKLNEANSFIDNFEETITFDPNIYVYKGIIELIKQENIKAYLYFLIGYRYNSKSYDLIYNIAYSAEKNECKHLAYHYYKICAKYSTANNNEITEINIKISELLKILKIDGGLV